MDKEIVIDQDDWDVLLKILTSRKNDGSLDDTLSTNLLLFDHITSQLVEISDMPLEYTIVAHKKRKDTAKLETAIAELKEWVKSQKLSIVSEMEIDHGVQLRVSDAINAIPVCCYTTGRMLVQGNQSGLKTRIEQWAYSRKEARKYTYHKYQ